MPKGQLCSLFSQATSSMMKDCNAFFTSWSKTRFFSGTTQILTLILFFIRCFPGCETRISGLMCCPSPISLATFGFCKQGAQLLPLQQLQGSFACPLGCCWNFIPPLSVVHAKLVKTTCLLPLSVTDTSSGVETGKWGRDWR